MNYTKSIQHLESKIENEWGGIAFNTSLPIESLISAREHFNQLLAFYSEKMAADYHDYLVSENARKRAFNEAKIKYLGEGNSVSKAEVFAEADIVNFREEEIEKDSEYHLSKMRRESIKETCNMLAQIIGVVRQEQEQQQFIKG